MSRSLALLPAVVAVSCAWNVTFEAPRLVASGDVGTDASGGVVVQLAPPSIALQTSSGMLSSVDGGSSWAHATGDCGRGFRGVPARLSPQSVQNYGTADTVEDKMLNYTHFMSANVTLFEAQTSGIACSAVHRNVSFTGIPRPVSCGGPPPGGTFGCPFRLAGGDTVTLADGSLLLSAIVWWGGNGASATSVLAFGSADGAAWTYLGTIADASAYPASQEGPNENALAALSDGRTVLCVLRLDAGDGPQTHPYANYAAATSTDGGRTWTHGESIAAGSARPRLLHLGADGAGAVAPAPLLLSGGRWHRGSYEGWDPLLWVGPSGTVASLSPAMSLSYWHNLLTPNASWRFTAAVNETGN